MLPTFNNKGDVVLVEHLSRRFYKLKPGDVVISACPYEPHKLVCKRLLALEGEVAPNNTKVPKGHVWVQGDSYGNSTDSRHYGPIPYALLRGKVFYKIWPPRDAGPIKDAPKRRGWFSSPTPLE